MPPPRDRKVVVVLPAYNAEKTLERTYDDIPKDWVDEILLVDDASSDRTVEVARQLGIPRRPPGEPRLRRQPEDLLPRRRWRARAATSWSWSIPTISTIRRSSRIWSSRFSTGSATPCSAAACSAAARSREACRSGSTSRNLFLTTVENATFYIFLSEYHCGFRAYSRRYLESVDFEANSDDFVFDTEIIAQGVAKGMRIREVPIETRYFDEASQIGFWRSVRYGLAILKTMVLYKLHKKRIWSHRIFRDPLPRPTPAAGSLPARRDARRRKPAKIAS